MHFPHIYRRGAWEAKCVGGEPGNEAILYELWSRPSQMLVFIDSSTAVGTDYQSVISL